MEESNTTTYRQFVEKDEREDLVERYKIVSIEENELYISIVNVDNEETENRYEPNRKGWEYGEDIEDSELPAGHLEELSDIKERLSISDSSSGKTEARKVRM
jgi:hypothetical protein